MLNRLFAVLIIFLLASIPVSAGSKSTVVSFTASLSQHKLPSIHSQTAYKAAVKSKMAKAFDYDLFATSVLAEYGPKANEKQKKRFTKKVKAELEDFFALYLSIIQAKKFKVTSRQKGKYSDLVKVIGHGKAGTKSNLGFSVSKDDSGKWGIRGVYLDGLNVRKKFHRTFVAGMKKHGNNMDLAISSWKPF